MNVRILLPLHDASKDMSICFGYARFSQPDNHGTWDLPKDMARPLSFEIQFLISLPWQDEILFRAGTM